jgi:putative methylase
MVGSFKRRTRLKLLPLKVVAPLMKKKQLEILLSKLIPNPKPKLKWEGYALDVKSASKMVYVASQIHNDIKGKNVVDLGCGSGILGISASLFGANQVLGIDIDEDAVKTAKLNMVRNNVIFDLVIGDIACLLGRFDTTLMNPPFGSRKKGSDLKFLEKAIEISNVVYSLHKRNNGVRNFLKQKIINLKGQIDRVYEMEIVIPQTYGFHNKKRYPVKVDLYRILKSKHRD